MNSLVDHRFLAGKAAASAVLGWAGVTALGNPDAVSAAFVAVICTSPIILSGLKRARDQVLGSLIGGAVAALFAWLGLPFALELALGVGVAVWLTIALGFGAGYQVAAFTAIYLLLIPRGTPVDTLLVRLSSVAVGGTAAVAVNGVVSLLMYVRIFQRKERLATELVAEQLRSIVATPEPPANGIEDLFITLGTLQSELADAVKELAWRKNPTLSYQVGRMANTARRLMNVAHQARNSLLQVRDECRGWSEAERVAVDGLADELLGGPSYAGPIPSTLQKVFAAARR